MLVLALYCVGLRWVGLGWVVSCVELGCVALRWLGLCVGLRRVVLRCAVSKEKDFSHPVLRIFVDRSPRVETGVNGVG